MSEKVFSKLKFICKDAIFFKEHESPDDYLSTKILSVLSPSPSSDKWQIRLLDPSDASQDDLAIKKIHLIKRLFEVWNAMKDQEFLNEGFTLGLSTRLDFVYGAFIPYFFGGKRYIDEVTCDFELTLMKLGEQENKPLFLEPLPELFRIFDKHPGDLDSFIRLGIVAYRDVLFYRQKLNSSDDIMEACGTLLAEYQNSIHQYSYASIETNADRVIPSTKERNVLWVSELKTRLLQPTLLQQPHDETNIVILCGLGHLRGIFEQDSGSFLSLLKKEEALFSEFERMNLEGG
ncbi:MAG: hypothetical protein FJX71_01635 [Alphaproteobacteria bacterium]|nr:hypothetical protein [Alphaproteobacteria bacterium]